jgi:hypothetical protein
LIVCGISFRRQRWHSATLPTSTGLLLRKLTNGAMPHCFVSRSFARLPRNLPPDIQALASEILWSDIRGMRNYIVHSYWQVDFAILVDVLRNDLGPLGTAAERLMAIVQSHDS